MTSDQVEQTLKYLLPIESFRSRLVPTLRFGDPAMCCVVGPRTRASADCHPIFWFAVEPSLARLVAFARTAAWSPGGIEPVPEAAELNITLSARDAHQLLIASRQEIAEAFFAGRGLKPEPADQIRGAYRAATPAPLYAWLRACCNDFFDWLDAHS